MAESLTLQQARRIILHHTPLLSAENVSLTDAPNRRPTVTLKAQLPIPHFRQSTMDGFAVHSSDIFPDKILPVKGEIAAGCTDLQPLPSGQAIRIMTGGAVPPGADQVIPMEHCRESEKGILVTHQGKRRNNIRDKGSDLKKGQIIIKKGLSVQPLHLQFLATSGYTSLPVFKKPSVAFLCTGSELVDKNPRPGQLISGNRSLLSGLIQKAQAIPVDLGTAADNTQTIADKIKAAGPVNVIVTTGGMGPGKYDLIKEVCDTIGIEVLYTSLDVRPGRATLFGIKDSFLFFGLPGPPPAAHILFQQLVKLAIHAFQGYSRPKPVSVKALLQEEITVKGKGLLNLKSALLFSKRGTLCVRENNATAQPPNAVICIPANRRKLLKGEFVTAYPFSEHYPS
jgi:molybdopterin molybdotransferase